MIGDGDNVRLPAVLVADHGFDDGAGAEGGEFRALIDGEGRALGAGIVGEICIRSVSVMSGYHGNPSATAKAVQDGWYLSGDAGYLDAEGRLWFCGRIAERVVTSRGTLHTEPSEQVFRGYPGVERCALVGLGEPGHQLPALVVQALKTVTDQPRLAEELRAHALRHPHTVSVSRILFQPSLPVDVRHNAKIHRLTLARWAAEQKGQETS